MKKFIFSVFLAFGFGMTLAPSSMAQVGGGYFSSPRDCDTWLSWNYNAQWNRGNMPPMMGGRVDPKFIWFCQSKGTGMPDNYYNYHFYDLSQGISYDHSQFRCERDYQRCDVRCAYVPIACIPYNP